MNAKAQRFLSVACCSCLLSTPVQSATVAQNVQLTWQQPQTTELYLPAITWHNRWTYDDEHINR